MAAELFWAFGRNEGTNKKIREHQPFKKYWNGGYSKSKKDVVANTD